jgi:acyl-CoA thioester hydrolase
MAEPFVHTFRVRYHECDAQGIVFNANWLSYFDVTLTEWFREAFGSYEALVEGRTVYVFVDPKTMGKREIPGDVRAKLGAYVSGTARR